MAGVGIENNSKLDGILTDYNTKYSDVFSRGLMTTYQHFCADVTTDKSKYEVVFYMNWPVMRPWVSGKQFKPLTAQSTSVILEAWEESYEIDWIRYISDPAGMAGLIDGSLADIAGELDKVVYDKLIAATGITGYDGVSYFNASHPVGSGTVSNTTTDAFTESNARAHILAMQLRTDDLSEPLGIDPNVLIVGPQNAHKAKEIFNADVRFIGLSASGVEATASVVAATTITNVWQGDLLVVVTPRFIGTAKQYWFLFDSNKSDKPLELVQHSRAPLRPTNDLSEFKAANPVVKLSVEGVLAVSFGPWQLSDGNFAT